VIAVGTPRHRTSRHRPFPLVSLRLKLFRFSPTAASSFFVVNVFERFFARARVDASRD